MKSYEAKLLSLIADEMPIPIANIPYASLSILLLLNDNDGYEHSIRKLADKLPYKLSAWPVFGQYVDDWYRVEVNEFKQQLQYCERGSCNNVADCEDNIDLSYRIFGIVSPSLTSSALKIANVLDRIEDQRLLIWLQMSSEIFHMYQVNQYFGMRKLNSNVGWMCEELVRMGIFDNPLDAIHSSNHILKGLMLSGLPKSMALKLYMDLTNQ